MAAPALSGVNGFGKYNTTGGSATTAVTSSMTTTAGRGMFAIFLGQAHGTATISDSQSNTWVEIGAEQQTTQFGFNVQISVWYCASVAGGAGHTVTGVGPTDMFPTIAAFEFDQGIALDQTTTVVDAALSWTAATLTTGVADTIVCACLLPAVSAGTGWTLSATGYTFFGEIYPSTTDDWDIGFLYKTVASASTAETPAISGTNLQDGENVPIRMVSFSAAASVSAATPSPAAGVATVSVVGSSTAASAPVLAAGTATVSAIGSSIAAADITPAAGTSTVSVTGEDASAGSGASSSFIPTLRPRRR